MIIEVSEDETKNKNNCFYYADIQKTMCILANQLGQYSGLRADLGSNGKEAWQPILDDLVELERIVCWRMGVGPMPFLTFETYVERINKEKAYKDRTHGPVRGFNFKR